MEKRPMAGCIKVEVMTGYRSWILPYWAMEISENTKDPGYIVYYVLCTL